MSKGWAGASEVLLGGVCAFMDHRLACSNRASSSSWPSPSSFCSSSSSSGSCRRRASATTDQSGRSSRAILDAFCSCPMVRIVAFGNGATKGSVLRDRPPQHLICSGASAVGDFSHELPSITVPRRKTSVTFEPRSPTGILFPSDLKVLDTHDEFLRGWLFLDSTALVGRIGRLCYRNCSYLQMGSRNRKSQSPTCGA
jgi:hypothetical protein